MKYFSSSTDMFKFIGIDVKELNSLDLGHFEVLDDIAHFESVSRSVLTTRDCLS